MHASIHPPKNSKALPCVVHIIYIYLKSLRNPQRAFEKVNICLSMSLLSAQANLSS